ncbi:hypothetical protein [Mucilaginibacter paludis]|uniref:CRISPR-associated protein Csh1 n=1 Tax=Mucilaginibacter paludis DSM 18603 TaxID=714943 RepID=H1YB51_9SPHI|nr:hypothetical protein [Mucilaginibacter paludis]EHQ30577.1 hypothetical protein Mucpa_6524 [Mucilaginibacter paludis DSM 18603]
MIKEIADFVNYIDPEFKALSVKPRDGLHILLTIKNVGQELFIDQSSLTGWVSTKNKEQTTSDLTLLKKMASLSQLAWCVNTNKCFDLPVKAIHSCSPYCLALKRENLENGEKYQSNLAGKKSQVYDRINAYFSKAEDLLESEIEKQRVEIFKQALNNQASLHTWLDQIPAYAELKDAEYVIFYLDEPIENYQRTNAVYLADKLFNTNNFNETIEETVFGTSDFFNGYPTKKPFLTHQTASFDIASRISSLEAKALYDFQNMIGIMPKPLPLFIYKDELKREAIALFKKGAETGEKLSYKDIMEALYQKHHHDLGNYYLLYYQFGEIKDFDFVSKFEYELKDENGRPWEIKDWFNIKYTAKVTDVFTFQYVVLVTIFNNALITKTKTGDFQHKYFDDIDAKYCKTDNTYLMVMSYRKAFYDFVFKSQRKAVTQQIFNAIMETGILDDIRLDEYKNNSHSQHFNIKQKLNIWFSLSEKFNQSNKSQITMASQLQNHRAFIQKLAKGEESIQSDDQYAFAIGQVVYYLLSKSKTADRSYKRLEPFLQQVHAKELNKAIARLFDTHKHENFSSNFRRPFAEVMDYETKANLRDLMPTMLAGIFSVNELFSNLDEADMVELEETE